MYKINFQEPIHIHFIGIGGISMSGLAEILFEEHFTISGSDSKESELTRHLEHMGMQIFYGQKASNIIEGIDLIVYTAAIREDNPEFAAAKAAGVDVSPAVQMAENILSKNSFDALAKSIAERVYAAVSKKMTVVDLHDDRLAQEKMKAMQMRLNLNKNKGGLN